MSEPRGSILVVDDEAHSRNALQELLTDAGYVVETAPDVFKALPKLETFNPDLVLTDLNMPGLSGLDLLRRCLADDGERAVIVMTAFGAVDTAVTAMREGASDYLAKPLNFDELTVVIERALERRRLRAETRQLRTRLAEAHRIESLVGQSKAMEDVIKLIVQVAPTRATVLVTGESGTGKELAAAALHQQSQRAAGPFVKLHCAALSETLLESELFGHERGAFTGAVGRRDGRFQQAHKGTLFLDEIGEISPAVQVKLLRFLQEREFERVGGNETIKVDVRVVAATNRNLFEQVQEGNFREDLYYRLNVVSVEMPSLRARPTDIPLLATHFLRMYAKDNDKTVTSFSDGALAALVRYRWPGNVRELANAVERAVVVSRSNVIEAADLPQRVQEEVPGQQMMPPIPGSSLADIEKFAILRTLEHVNGSTAQAARILGISPRKIQYRLQEYQTGLIPGSDGDTKS